MGSRSRLLKFYQIRLGKPRHFGACDVHRGIATLEQIWKTLVQAKRKLQTAQTFYCVLPTLCQKLVKEPYTGLMSRCPHIAI